VDKQEKRIREKIDKHLDIIQRDIETDRSISAILSGIGIMYTSEHETARNYLKELGVEL